MRADPVRGWALPDEAGLPVVVARRTDPDGEIVLRRRGDVTELVVDGVFAMDSVHTDTEKALARLALQALPERRGPGAPGLEVVVGGLGLGYTCRALLADPRVGRVVVVELHQALVDWVRDGLVPPARGVLDDPRVEVVVGDVVDVVPALPAGCVDAVLLDVDNGPAFLVHAANTAVYAPPFLRAAAAALRPDGVLGVWSADPAPELALVLERICGACAEHLLHVQRDGRDFTYAVYLAGLPPAPDA